MYPTSSILTLSEEEERGRIAFFYLQKSFYCEPLFWSFKKRVGAIHTQKKDFQFSITLQVADPPPFTPLTFCKFDVTSSQELHFNKNQNPHRLYGKKWGVDYRGGILRRGKVGARHGSFAMTMANPFFSLVPVL